MMRSALGIAASRKTASEGRRFAGTLELRTAIAATGVTPQPSSRSVQGTATPLSVLDEAPPRHMVWAAVEFFDLQYADGAIHFEHS